MLVVPPKSPNFPILYVQYSHGIHDFVKEDSISQVIDILHRIEVIKCVQLEIKQNILEVLTQQIAVLIDQYSQN